MRDNSYQDTLDKGSPNMWPIHFGLILKSKGSQSQITPLELGFLTDPVQPRLSCKRHRQYLFQKIPHTGDTNSLGRCGF